LPDSEIQHTIALDGLIGIMPLIEGEALADTEALF